MFSHLPFLLFCIFQWLPASPYIQHRLPFLYSYVSFLFLRISHSLFFPLVFTRTLLACRESSPNILFWSICLFSAWEHATIYPTYTTDLQTFPIAVETQEGQFFTPTPDTHTCRGKGEGMGEEKERPCGRGLEAWREMEVKRSGEERKRGEQGKHHI